MEYLKDDIYYSDLYDLLTIKNCIRSIEVMRGKIKGYKKEEDLMKIIK